MGGFTMKDNGQVCHYLEAAPNDMSTALEWASVGYKSTPIASMDASGSASTPDTSIGAGRKNTDLIIATDATAPTAKACKDYRGPNNLTDWFLPSKDELTQLYTTRSFVGNMTTSTYWSSSQYNGTDAWSRNFYNGQQGYYVKGYAGGVRAIRAF